MRASLVLLLGLVACGGGAGLPPAATPLPLVTPDEQLADLLQDALDADARFEPAERLYNQDAIVVANGLARFAPPRYAGIEPGGAVAIAASRLEVRGGMAWARVEYRWMSTDEGKVREGQVTFVLVAERDGAWRIRHAHSSSPEG